MDRTKSEKSLILLITLACLGLTVETLVMGWEFWVPPLIVTGIVAMWVMHFTGNPDYEIRIVFCFIFTMLAAFFHGIHETSFFDVSLIIMFSMISFSFLNRAYMMNCLLAEFFVIMSIQFMLAFNGAGIEFDSLNISRIILHIMIVLLVYYNCIRSLMERSENMAASEEKDERIKAYDKDMEDFLSNISHELRTPVNVVNGMSDLLIKRNVGEEPYSIKNAGIRLTNQIEDIQDYTECKRGDVLLEEDDYMSTSLINDVVMFFRHSENEDQLELVVDLDPNVPTMMRGDIKKLHKIFRHLLENSVKFTRRGGIYIHMYSENTDYGVNLCIEMTDTGFGMDRKTIQSISEGLYQVNKKRNRSTGGIGLGLYIVYGFAHSMGGFIKIESERRVGTTIRVTIPQKIVDPSPCLAASALGVGDILFHVRSDKYKVPLVRDFYRAMAKHLAAGIKVPLYSAESIKEIERLKQKLNVTYIFMGQEEYEANSGYFDELSKGDVVVAVSANAGFEKNKGSNVIVMPKPLYAYPVIRILNEGRGAVDVELAYRKQRPVFSGIRALIVDDEPMNLVVASGIFKDYEMEIDTAGSGREAIKKYRGNDYDVVFMDHMMPEMDGVEAMKEIKRSAKELDRKVKVIALTANVVSGAREMFINEGFDGFIAKPIDTADFERVMERELPGNVMETGGEA